MYTRVYFGRVPASVSVICTRVRSGRRDEILETDAAVCHGYRRAFNTYIRSSDISDKHIIREAIWPTYQLWALPVSVMS